MKASDALILSIFPGIDMFGRAFHQQGFCVVKGPDISIDGGDIREFKPPAGRFNGVIGGSPCQDFSSLNRNPGDEGLELLGEYIRVVKAADPDWFLFENVIRAPQFDIPGYVQQRFVLDLAWFSDYSRKRVFVFGSKAGIMLNPMISTTREVKGTAVTGGDERSFSACCEIQGLPADFDLPFFSLEGKKQAVGNGVPLQLGGYVAGLIKQAIYNETPAQVIRQQQRRCPCGCGRQVVGRAQYAGAACRKREQRRRDRAA